MRIVGYPKEFYHAARLRKRPLSAKAHERLRWLMAWQVGSGACPLRWQAT